MNGALTDIKNCKNALPIFYAARNNHHRIVEVLLNYGADFQTGINSESYLVWAARNGYYEVIESLVKRGVDINEKNFNISKSYEMRLLFKLPFKMAIMMLLS